MGSEWLMFKFWKWICFVEKICLFSSCIFQLLYHLTLEMKLIKCVLGDEGGERGAEGTEDKYDLPILVLFGIKILVSQGDMK